MARKKRSTNRRKEYVKKPHNLLLILKVRPFDEERWKQLLTAMAYEIAKQKKAKVEDSSAAQEEFNQPK